jgi:glycosyltransferase involved in cell wall biosynthesis
LQFAESDKRRDISFVFYEYNDDDPKKLLTIPKNVKYETVKLGVMPENDKSASKSQKLQRHIKDMYGNPIKDSSKSDIFLQFDYAFGVPKNTKTLLIKHDLIPYVFWDKYFDSAMRHFKNKAARTTLRTLFHNYRFMRVLRRSLRNAHVIVAVSDSTKNDVIKYFKTPPKKVKTALLGVDIEPAKTTDVDKSSLMPFKPYLLFVGAGDARRRVDDAVAAFNGLKADGRDIQLVLVGENFKQPTMIPNKTVRDAVLHSSYKDDILTLGYVDDATKQSLYKNAVAYVYPTKYEGFGIPVLESMLLECPIITYRNSSIPEVGGKHAIYVRDWMGIKLEAERLLDQSPKDRKKTVSEAKKHAEQFTWDKTARVIYDELLSK